MEYARKPSDTAKAPQMKAKSNCARTLCSLKSHRIKSQNGASVCSNLDILISRREDHPQEELANTCMNSALKLLPLVHSNYFEHMHPICLCQPATPPKREDLLI